MVILPIIINSKIRSFRPATLAVRLAANIIACNFNLFIYLHSAWQACLPTFLSSFLIDSLSNVCLFAFLFGNMSAYLSICISGDSLSTSISH